MKNNAKNAIIYIGGFYMLIIAVFMVITYCNITTKVELSSNSDYQLKLNAYKEEISNYDNSSCKSYLNELINIVEKDINVEEINLQEYYQEKNDEDSLLSYYSKGVNACNSLSTELMQEANMTSKFLVPPILSEETVSKYFYQYELSLKDLRVRSINEVVLGPVENNIKIQTELEIIKDLIKIIDWGKEV